MRVLVTGGTGFIGQHLVTALVQRPETAVILLLREAYSHVDIKPLPAALTAVRSHLDDIVYADLRNFQLTTRAVRQANPDVVIHLAAAGVTDPFLGIDTAIRHNVNGTVNLARACFETHRSVEKLVVGRTPGEHTQMNVYAASKSAGWGFCQMFAQTHAWPIVGGMIFQAYGPGQPDRTLIPSAIGAALANQNFPMTAGTQQRDWIFVEDVAAGLMRLITSTLSPGETADLGTGVLTSVADVVQQIYALVDGSGTPQVGALPGRPGETAVQVANQTRTSQLLNWQPALSLTQGLKKTITAVQTTPKGG